MVRLTELGLFEVYSGQWHRKYSKPQHPSNDELWDAWLTAGGRAYGLAGDDSHRFGEFDFATPGKGWVMVRCRELSSDAVLAAVEAGEFGLFYVELTGIVRVFVERTTGVKAPDQTTEEFLHEAEHHGAFTEVRRQALQRFLEAADLVKYAAQVPGSHEVTEAVDSAHAFCQQEAEQGAPCAARS